MGKEKKVFVEEGDFLVTMKATNVITFAPIERDGPLTLEDAIGNAKGTFPDGWLETASDEGWEFEFTAEAI